MAEEAFEQLARHYERQLQSYILRIVGDVEVARELTQDMFLKLWEKRRDPRADGFTAQAYTIARGLAVDTIRKGTRRRTDPASDVGDQPSNKPSAEEAIVHLERSVALQRAIEGLPPTLRTVVERRLSEEKFEQIAQELGLDDEYCRQLSVRGTRLLRKALGALGIGGKS